MNTSIIVVLKFENEKKVRNKAELNIYYDNISEQFNLKINSDETRLQQVIINLITNNLNSSYCN